MSDHEKSIDDSIRRIAEGLRTALRLAEISQRACERELGLTDGYLTRILAGQVQLRVGVVLRLCQMIGLPPAAFFTALFPDTQISEPTARILRALAAVHRPDPSSGAAASFDNLPSSPGSPPPFSSPVSLDVVLLQLRDAVGKLETFAGRPASASDPSPVPGSSR